MKQHTLPSALASFIARPRPLKFKTINFKNMFLEFNQKRLSEGGGRYLKKIP